MMTHWGLDVIWYFQRNTCIAKKQLLSLLADIKMQKTDICGAFLALMHARHKHSKNILQLEL